MATRTEILQWCDETLQTKTFKDYAPNGLQVEGADGISTIMTSVTASQAAIEAAIKQGAQMLLVHHGMFWKSEPIEIIGWKKRRIAALIKNDINMVGYHLPLDAHETLGNNAQLAQKCGWQTDYRCGEQNLLNIGHLPQTQTLADFVANMEQVLQRKATVVGNLQQNVQKVAWCTGGAQGFFQQAIDEGVDVFVTGEISEAQFHLANETGVAFVSAGHHATEKFGVRALGEALVMQFGVKIYHFDEQNPA
ncbi:MAG: Nif3-like dinuclear metal center hexameric protein [Neisseria sp.]|nr:Nif3-like dinuclear metal center hexameric protein [Neisseria sp.]